MIRKMVLLLSLLVLLALVPFGVVGCGHRGSYRRDYDMWGNRTNYYSRDYALREFFRPSTTRNYSGRYSDGFRPRIHQSRGYQSMPRLQRQGPNQGLGRFFQPSGHHSGRQGSGRQGSGRQGPGRRH